MFQILSADSLKEVKKRMCGLVPESSPKNPAWFHDVCLIYVSSSLSLSISLCLSLFPSLSLSLWLSLGAPHPFSRLAPADEERESQVVTPSIPHLHQHFSSVFPVCKERRLISGRSFHPLELPLIQLQRLGLNKSSWSAARLAEGMRGRG